MTSIAPTGSAPTVYDALRASALRAPDAPALHITASTARAYGIAAREYRYGELLAAIDTQAGAYRAAGVIAGLRIGLMLENRPDFFIHWLALNALGASVVPINTELRTAELEYLFDNSELCLVMALPHCLDALRAAIARGGRDILLATPGDALPALQARPVCPPPATPRGAECALLYTSGTTGLPKGCVLDNDYFLLSGKRYLELGGLCEIRPGVERLITPLPMVHMNAMACSTTAMLLSGGCIIPLDRFHPASWWSDVRESGATIVHYLGVMPAMLMGAGADPLDRAHLVRFGFGAGVAHSLHQAFETRFGFPLVEAWGMTETGNHAAIVANLPPRRIGRSCIGRPPAHVDIRLVDAAGRDVPAGADGELLVRIHGENPRRGFFREYLKNPEATAEAWVGGWFHTGDVVRQDEEGYLYFVDRRKNVIRRSGENISAVEVESVLLRHPAIRAVGVAPTPDPVRGEEVFACIVARERPEASHAPELAAAIVDWALQELSYFKVPGYIAFVDELQLTTSQKIQRALLKEVAATLPGTAACIDLRHLKKRPRDAAGHA